MKRILMFGVVIAVLAFQSVCYAQAQVTEKLGGVTSTGIVSYISTSDGGNTATKEWTVFSGYDVGTDTEVFNDAGGSAATSGWVNVQDYNDDITFHVNLTTLGSTGNTFTVEALLSDDTTAPISIFAAALAAVDIGYHIPLAEGALKYIRIGLQATGTEGTDAATVIGRAEGHK